MNPVQKFSEDVLPLLSKPIKEHTANSFWEYVNSLFEPRTSSGKVAVLKPKGKIISNPTKSDKRPYGEFEIKYTTALGIKKFVFKFNRERQVQCSIEEISKKIECSQDLVEQFLKKKKFSLTD